MTLWISGEKVSASVSLIISDFEMAGQYGRRVGEANDEDQEAVEVSGEDFVGTDAVQDSKNVIAESDNKDGTKGKDGEEQGQVDSEHEEIRAAKITRRPRLPTRQEVD